MAAQSLQGLAFAAALLLQAQAAVIPGPTPTPVSVQQLGVASVVESLTSALAPEVSSYLSGLPTDALQGVLPAFNDLPNAANIKSKLNISDEQVAAQPLRVLNIPCVSLRNPGSK